MAQVKLFAALREAAGSADAEIDAPTLGVLLDVARKRWGPEFAACLERASVALNGQEISRGSLSATPVASEDEVALLPPVSGGCSS